VTSSGGYSAAPACRCRKLGKGPVTWGSCVLRADDVCSEQDRCSWRYDWETLSGILVVARSCSALSPPAGYRVAAFDQVLLERGGGPRVVAGCVVGVLSFDVDSDGGEHVL
jgi:hypothetical protein